MVYLDCWNFVTVVPKFYNNQFIFIENQREQKKNFCKFQIEPFYSYHTDIVAADQGQIGIIANLLP